MLRNCLYFRMKAQTVYEFLCAVCLSATASLSGAQDAISTIQDLCLPQRFALKYTVVGRGAHQPEIKSTIEVYGLDGKIRTDFHGGLGAHRVIYDGKNTYFVDGNERRIYVVTGFYFRPFQGTPMPGMGLPYLPLIKLARPGSNHVEIRGDIYTDMPPATNNPVYLPGRIILSQPGGRQVAMAEFDYREQVLGRWEFLAYKAFDGISIASTIRRSYFAPSPGTESKLPTYSTIYTLDAASLNAPAEDQFDPLRDWKNNSPGDPRQALQVQWNDGPSAVAFIYQPGKSLEAQRDAAREGQLAAERTGVHRVKSGKIAPQNNYGSLLLGILLFFGGWWLLWNHRAKRRGGSSR